MTQQDTPLARAEKAFTALGRSDKYKPHLELLLPLDRQDQTRLLKLAARNTEAGERDVRADFKDLQEAEKEKQEEASAKETIKEQVQEELGEPPSIDSCVAKRDFLSACVVVLSEGDDAPYSFDELSAAAKENGLAAEFERDRAVAPELQASRDLCARAGEGIGRKITVTPNGSIVKWIGKKANCPSLVTGSVIISATGDNGESDTPNPHLLLKIRRPDKSWVQYPLDMSLLKKSGDWTTDASKRDFMVLDSDTFCLLLKAARASGAIAKRFRTVERVGHAGRVFVLPNGEVVRAAGYAGEIVPVGPKNAAWSVGGTKEEADEMLGHCAGNTRLVLGICTVLAAPYVRLMQAENGGLHFYAETSQGKTTLLCVAASMFGLGGEEQVGGIVKSWNTTLFAASLVGALHNDMPWLNDELKMDAKAGIVQPFIHMLSKGVGKDAGGKDGALREKRPFATLMLSTGECSIKRYMESHNLTYEGGEAVRISDIPAVARGSQNFVFERVPTEMNAAGFSEYLKETASKNYGHHGRMALQYLLDDPTGAIDRARGAEASLRLELGERFGDEPDVGRVLDRLAFIGGVNEAHIAAGILPFSKGEAANAVWSAARDWHAARGGEGNQEALSAITHFTEHVVVHRARFLDASRQGDHSPYSAAGITAVDMGRREYWFTQGQLIEAIGQAQRLRAFIQYLKDGQSCDWALVSDAGRDQRQAPKKWDQPQKRLYCIAQKNSAENM